MKNIEYVIGIIPTCDCILWTGYVQSGGYGQIYNKGKRILVHRKAYIDAYGDIPVGMYVCHQCDNKLCINPEHLWLGTPKQNTKDAHIKGRVPYGCNKGIPRKRKLTDQNVLDIRGSKQTLKELAILYGVSITTISLVKRNLRK